MNEINPYASPADVVSPPQQHQQRGDEQYSMYPIKFHPTIQSPVVAILFTVILIVGVGTAWQMLMEPTSKPDIIRLMTLMGTFGALGTMLCFICTWVRVVVHEDSIQKRDLSREEIRFNEIDSWHLNSDTGNVEFTLASQTVPFAVQNWAMTRDNSRTLARILHNQIGPPRQANDASMR